jgi:cell division protein FtsB
VTRRSHAHPDPGGPFLRGRPSPPRWHRHRLALIAGAVLLLLLVTQLLGENGLPVYLALRGEAGRLQSRVDQRRAQDAELRAWIAAVQTDRDVLERLARERYNMQRPGEMVYEVVESDPRSGRSP